MKNISTTLKNKSLRARRTRSSINRGKTTHPRLSVAKSNKQLFAQIIDDTKGHTLVGILDTSIAKKGEKRMDRAKSLGEAIAKKAAEMKIANVVFDRGHNKYHGIVKAVADGAREAGLKI